jgi:hypothetical protein
VGCSCEARQYNDCDSRDALRPVCERRRWCRGEKERETSIRNCRATAGTVCREDGRARNVDRLSKLDIFRFISRLLVPLETELSARSLIISRIEEPDCRSRSEHTLTQAWFPSDANSVYELDEMDDNLKTQMSTPEHLKTKRQIKSTHAKSNVIACDNKYIRQAESKARS